MNQKGFAPIVIVLIVVVLLIGGVLAWQYFGAPEKVEDETAGWKTYQSPDGTLRAQIIPLGETQESMVQIRTNEGVLLQEVDYSSEDGDHGLKVILTEWTPNSQFFIYSAASSGGHQPWFSRVYFYNRSDNKIYYFTEMSGFTVANDEFVVTAPDIVTFTVYTSVGLGPTVTKSFKLSEMPKIETPENETVDLRACRTEYLDKIGETKDFLIYHIKEINIYRVFKCNLQTNKETELELLGHLDNTNVELSLSPNGKYITKTSWFSPSELPKIELMSFDNVKKLTTLAEGEKDSFIQMIWSDDSSKIAYWTVNRGSAPYPSFKVYYLASITGAEPKLMKTYNDMTMQGLINLKKLISSENRLYLERTKIMNGAPPVWEEDIIEL